jgi:hypothetical protein
LCCCDADQERQISNSGDTERPYEVEGDTFVRPISPSIFLLSLKIPEAHVERIARFPVGGE